MPDVIRNIPCLTLERAFLRAKSLMCSFIQHCQGFFIGSVGQLLYIPSINQFITCSNDHVVYGLILPDGLINIGWTKRKRKGEHQTYWMWFLDHNVRCYFTFTFNWKYIFDRFIFMLIKLFFYILITFKNLITFVNL